MAYSRVTWAAGNTITATLLNTSEAYLEALGNTDFLALKSSSGGQSLNQSTATKIQYETEAYDTGSNYDPAAYRFTAPAAGEYLVQAGFAGSFNMGAGNRCELRLYKNGAHEATLATRAQSGASAVGGNLAGSYKVKLAAADYLEIYAYQTGTNGAVSVNNSTTESYFSVKRLG